MVFIRPVAAGTRGAPKAALRREAGAKKSLGALFSKLLGSTVSSGPEPRGYAAPPELPCAERRVLEPRGHMAAPELP
jgi:hypothetical protein